MDLLGKKKIWKYYLFNENISNNAFAETLEHARRTYLNYETFPFTIVTDGDLTVSDSGWLDEQMNILKRNPDVFVVGSTLDMANLPLKTMPESKNWIPPVRAIHPDYLETWTGLWLLTFRTIDLREYLEYRSNTGGKFLDSNLHAFCNAKHMKWARTKRSKSIHLTWSLYHDLSHPYTIMKVKNAGTIWNHNRTCGYQLFE
jgi:hypothetical protein